MSLGLSCCFVFHFVFGPPNILNEKKHKSKNYDCHWVRCRVRMVPCGVVRVECYHQPNGGGVNNTTERSEGESNRPEMREHKGNGDNRTISKKDGNAASIRHW